MSLTVTKWPGIESVSPVFLRRLDAAARARGWKTDDLLGHIWFESRFDPAARNKAPGQTAAGLIQMTNDTAKRFAGVPSSALVHQNEEQQLAGIVAYFDVGRPLAGADFRLLGYSRNPSLLNAPDGRVIYGDPSIAELNPTAAEAAGVITVGSVRREWQRHVESKRQKLGTYQVPARAPVSAEPQEMPVLLLGAGLMLALGLARKGRWPIGRQG